MTIDYIVASLPALVFDQPPAISWEKFASLCADAGKGIDELTGEKWADLETQLKNAVAVARGGAKWVRAAEGCSVYWRTKVAHAFQEKDVAKRDELLDRIWWDAAEELTDLTSPLGAGALATSINMDSSVTVGEKKEEIPVENVQEKQIRDVMEPILQKARAQAQEILDNARAQAKKEIEELNQRKAEIENDIEALKKTVAEEGREEGL